MNAAFVAKPGVDPAALDKEHGLLDAFKSRGAQINELRPPALGLGETGVKTQEFGREESGLLPSRAGPDFKKNASILAGILGNELQTKFLFQGLALLGDLGLLRSGHLPQFRVAAGKQSIEVRELAFQAGKLPHPRDQGREFGVAAGELLEIRGGKLAAGQALLQVRELFMQLF